MASVRRVRRVIRKFDPWTVLKVSIVFHAVMSVAFVLGLVILWAVVNNAGIPQAIEDFGKKITLLEADAELFADGERYLRVAVFLGVVWTVLMTGLTTLAAVISMAARTGPSARRRFWNFTFPLPCGFWTGYARSPT